MTSSFREAELVGWSTRSLSYDQQLAPITSQVASSKGAERLLGKGHLLAKLEGERDLCYAQVPFVQTSFIEALVATARRDAR